MLLAREHEIKAGVNMKYTNTHKCQKSKPHYIKGQLLMDDNAPFYLSNKHIVNQRVQILCIIYIILIPI